MKSILLLLLSFALAAGEVQAGTALITLDDGFTWKAMFDAGFRPAHSEEGIYECRQRNVHVQIRKQAGGEILDLGVGDVEFSIREGHLLDTFGFYGREYRAVNEVQEKSNVFSRILGSAVVQKADFAWFEVTHTEGYGGQKIDPPEITREVDAKKAENGAKMDGLTIVYSFRAARSGKNPMMEMFTIAIGPDEMMRTPRLKSKIQPPAGYEHISMEAEPAGTAAAPAAVSIDPAGQTQSSSVLDPGKSSLSPLEPTARSEDDNSPNTFSWSWVVGVVLVLCVIGGVLLRFLRKHFRNDKPH